MATLVCFKNPTSKSSIDVAAVYGDVKTKMPRILEACNLPADTEWNIVKSNDQDKYPVFKNARVFDKKTGHLSLDLEKSKSIAHEQRRKKRSQEFVKIDGDNMNVMVTAEAETERQKVRDKYSLIQDELEKAADMDALQAEIEKL